MADDFSSQRPKPDRAPRLRRIADLVDHRAELTDDPVKARALAREMRLRAAELETGDGDHGEGFTDKIRALGFQG